MAVRHEKQRKVDVTKFQCAETQILLKEVGIGVFDAVPSSSLRQRFCRYKVHNVAAQYDPLPKRLKSALAARVVMLIEPRGEFDIL
jgi:hypothetical protein